MKKIRVVLADDHAIARHGLRSILCQDKLIEVVGEAENGRDAVELVKKMHPDVAVLEISMPLLNGLKAAQRIRRFDTGIKVILLSMHRDEEYVRAAYRAGAMGYVSKQTSGRDLISAIKEVNRGIACFSTEIAEQKASDNCQTARNGRVPKEPSGRTSRK